MRIVLPALWAHWSIEMMLGIPFSSTVRGCSMICEIGIGPYARDSQLFYFSVLLLVFNVTSGGQLT